MVISIKGSSVAGSGPLRQIWAQDKKKAGVLVEEMGGRKAGRLLPQLEGLSVRPDEILGAR